MAKYVVRSGQSFSAAENGHIEYEYEYEWDSKLHCCFHALCVCCGSYSTRTRTRSSQFELPTPIRPDPGNKLPLDRQSSILIPSILRVPRWLAVARDSVAWLS